MKRMMLLSLALTLFYTGLNAGSSRSYPENDEIFIRPSFGGWTHKRYYAFAYDYHLRKIPNFKKRIDPKYLHFFKKFYVVYLKHRQVLGFEVYENKTRFSRNTILERYVQHERFDFRGRTILYQKLHYDRNNRLRSEENFINDKLFTYYIYHYNNENHIEKIDIYNYHGDLVSSVKYNYDYDGSLESLDRKSGHVFYDDTSFPKQEPGKKIRVTQILKNRNSLYRTTTMYVKIYNPSNYTFGDLSISTDLYNLRGELVDSVSGKPTGYDSILEPGSTLVLKTSETRKSFSRMRLYIHYNLGDSSKSFYIGPFIYFGPQNKKKHYRYRFKPY